MVRVEGFLGRSGAFQRVDDSSGRSLLVGESGHVVDVGSIAWAQNLNLVVGVVGLEYILSI